MPATDHDRKDQRALSPAPADDLSPAGAASVRSYPQGLRIKRAYAPRTPQDGRRVLVDRLWPRGLSKQDLKDVLWLRDVAPSAALRKWFDHKPERWTEFRARYFAELRANPMVETLQTVVAAGPVTLIYGARDETHNQAVALAEYLGEQTARDAEKGHAA